jgi:hypothetical protein
MVKTEAQLEKEIKELMRKAEILDAQEDGKYGRGKLGSELPKELRRRQERLEKIKQARKALEAEATAAAARDRAKQAAAAEAAAVASDAEVEADASEQQKLREKADRSREKAEAAKNLAIEKAREASLEPEGLEPKEANAMPHRGLAHRADGSPTASAQRNFTDPDSHIMKSCPASSPLADWRQSSWPVRGTDRPPVVAGDNRGAMTLEATRKLSYPSVRAIASTDFL